MSKKYISGVFKSKIEAGRSIDELMAKGFKDNQISLMMSDSTKKREFDIQTKSKAAEGTAAGASLGGAIGGIVAAATAVGALAIPGLNVLAAGPIIAIAAGVGAGGALGGVAGALTGLGFTEREAKVFQDEVKNGNILIAVEVTNDNREAVENIFKRHEAKDVKAA